MTLYGDLDISVIDELPPGRKPIKTEWKTDAKRLEVFQFKENEIKSADVTAKEFYETPPAVPGRRRDGPAE